MKLLRGILGIFCLGGAVLTNQGAAALAQITLLCVAALLGGSRLHAQPALNRVLELDGDGSYVELPANLLANLKEVTVEGWVNWASFHLASRFFDFGGGPFQLNVQNRGGTSTLWFESPEGRTYRAVTLPDQLRTNEWFHIAAVRSPEVDTVISAIVGAGYIGVELGSVWNRLGAYVVHVALITIFTGGFMTSRYGVGGSMEIKPGKTSDKFATSEVLLDGARESQAVLPFQIECTDLQQKLIKEEGGLDNSNTIDWLSYIRIVDKQRNVSQDMLVHLNNVGDYRGYRFFQNSFLPVGNARQITIAFEPAAGGGAALPPVTIRRNGSAEVPGIGTVRYVNFYPDFDVDSSGPTTLSRDYNNPAAQLEIAGPDGKRTMSFAFNPQLAEQYLTKANEKVGKEGGENPLLVNGNKIILRDFEKVSLTHTLTIQYDPGRTPVYMGFTLLVIALCGVFFFSHQRVWAVVEPNGRDSKIYFGGNTNRNRPAFEGRFNSLVQSVTGGLRNE